MPITADAPATAHRDTAHFLPTLFPTFFAAAWPPPARMGMGPGPAARRSAPSPVTHATPPCRADSALWAPARSTHTCVCPGRTQPAVPPPTGARSFLLLLLFRILALNARSVEAATIVFHPSLCAPGPPFPPQPLCRLAPLGKERALERPAVGVLAPSTNRSFHLNPSIYHQRSTPLGAPPTAANSLTPRPAPLGPRRRRRPSYQVTKLGGRFSVCHRGTARSRPAGRRARPPAAWNMRREPRGHPRCHTHTKYDRSREKSVQPARATWKHPGVKQKPSGKNKKKPWPAREGEGGSCWGWQRCGRRRQVGDDDRTHRWRPKPAKETTCRGGDRSRASKPGGPRPCHPGAPARTKVAGG